MVPPPLAAPLDELVDSSVVDPEPPPVPVLLVVLLPVLVSVLSFDEGPDVPGGDVVKGDVSPCPGWHAGTSPRARRMGRNLGLMTEESSANLPPVRPTPLPGSPPTTGM